MLSDTLLRGRPLRDEHLDHGREATAPSRHHLELVRQGAPRPRALRGAARVRPGRRALQVHQAVGQELLPVRGAAHRRGEGEEERRWEGSQL